MKRIFAILIAVFLLLVAVSCAPEEQSESKTEEASQSVQAPASSTGEKAPASSTAEKAPASSTAKAPASSAKKPVSSGGVIELPRVEF